MIPNTRRNKVREIDFRAKAKNKKCCVYGDLIHCENGYSIIEKKGGYIKVKPETIGQYTAVDDINKRKIFENDIVDLILPYKTIRCKVVFEKGHFKLVDDYDSLVYYISPSLDMKVLGNIFDNPELMEESNDN